VGAPRPSHLLSVPPLVDRAAPSGVVPGELGGAAVLGASSGFAEGAHHRSGAGSAASAIASQHHHAWIVPPPKQGKHFAASPYPPVGLAVVALGRLTPARSSARVVLVDTVGAGLAGRGPKGSAHRGLRVVGGRAGLAPARPAQIGGQVAGVQGSRASAHSAAVDPGREVAWP
jgi:hypothetical protein